jgi:hypothetical protein
MPMRSSPNAGRICAFISIVMKMPIRNRVNDFIPQKYLLFREHCMGFQDKGDLSIHPFI